MRNIIFRGSYSNKGKWVYGDLIHRNISGNALTVIRVSDEGADSYEEYYVDPKTVGEYTGRSDKNRDMIYEGDIVRYGGKNHLVVFENRNGSAYFGIVMGPHETWPLDHYSDDITIVGNIHDNPELLKDNT